jgi:RNA polymerase sigma factor (sigma-70 family)
MTGAAGQRPPSSEPVATDFSELLGPDRERAAEELSRTVRMLVGQFCGRYDRARDQREDLTQEVLRICIEQAIKIREGRAVPLANRNAWLVRVTHHAVLALYRRAKSRPKEEEIPEGFDLPAPRQLGVEEKLTLRKAIGQLGEECRKLLLWREVLGETRQAIAAALGLDENVLGVRLHRCRRHLLALYLGEKPA